MSSTHRILGSPGRFPLLRDYRESTPAERRRRSREVIALRDRLRAERLANRTRPRPEWPGLEAALERVYLEHRVDPASGGTRCACGAELAEEFSIERHVAAEGTLALIGEGVVLPGRERNAE